MDTDPTVDISISNLRKALRWLERDRVQLARSELTGLALVQQRRSAAKARFDAGDTLKDVLRDALDELRPGTGEPQPTQPEWQSFFILREQYVKGRSHEVVQEEVALSQSEYYREQQKALEALAAALRNAERDARARAQLVSAPASTLVQATFPPAPAHEQLIARDGIYSDVKARLLAAASQGRPLMLGFTGLPGVGKTAMLIELAHDADIRRAFPDGVLWGAMGPSPDTDAILRGWGRALGLTDEDMSNQPTTAQRINLVRAALADRRTLLFLDDVWAAEHADIMKAVGRGCAALFTTRQPEVAAALAGANVVRLAELTTDQGTALLAAYATAAAEAYPADARSLVEAVGGLPLAIVIAGRYLRGASHSNQTRRLRASMDALKQATVRMGLPVADGAGALRRTGSGPSLAAIISVSESALEPAARHALRALAAFPPKPNTFSEAAALAVTGATTDELDALVDAGLIETRPGDRYTVHQVIAEYAALQPEPGARAAFARHFCAFVVAHQTDYASIELEIDNVRSALDVAREDALDAELLAGARVFGGFLIDRGAYASARALLAGAEFVARRSPEPRDLVRHLLLQAQVSSRSREFEQAAAQVAEAERLVRVIDDDRLKVEVYDSLSSALHSLGKTDEAIQCARLAIKLAQKTGQLAIVPRLMMSIGEYQALDQPDRVAVLDAEESRALALKSLQFWFAGISQVYYNSQPRAGKQSLLLALQFARATANPAYVIHALGFLSELSYTLGDYDEALRFASEGLALGRRVIFPRSIGFMFSTAGLVNLYRGNTEHSLRLLESGLAEARQANFVENIAWIGLALAAVCEETGQIPRAHALALESLAYARQSGQLDLLGYHVSVCARMSARLGRVEEAQTYARDALAVSLDVSQKSYAMLSAGVVNELQGRIDEGLAAFRQSAEMAAEVGAVAFAAEANWGLARMLAVKGDTDAARVASGEALRLFEGLGDVRAAATRQLSSGLGSAGHI